MVEASTAQVEIIEYLKNPPSAEELRQILGALGMSPRQLIRTKESVYLDLNLADTALADPALITAMVDNPILIERPIAFKEGRAHARTRTQKQRRDWKESGTGVKCQKRSKRTQTQVLGV